MKIFDVVDTRVNHEYRKFNSLEEAYEIYPSTIKFVEAPDWVMEGYGFDPEAEGDARFIRPELGDGWEYDEDGYPWNPEEQRAAERKARHVETTNDTLQALRKLREGDKTIDWQAWLDQLDAYNIAIEKTKEQAGYPQNVVYPEYPTKPAGAS